MLAYGGVEANVGVDPLWLFRGGEDGRAIGRLVDSEGGFAYAAACACEPIRSAVWHTPVAPLPRAEEKPAMESLRRRCQVVTGVFAAMVVVSAVAALSSLSLVRYLQGISSGEPVDEARAEGIDARQTLIAILSVGLFVVGVIAFLMWFYRAHKNLKAGGLTYLQYTPGWAVGGFFVPFLNFVRPFQVMKEVWAGSAFLSGDVQARVWTTVSPSPLVGWWWGLFLVTSFLGNRSGKLMLGAEELGEVITAGKVALVSDLLDIPSAVLALILVRRVTQLQERARTRFQSSENPLGA